MKCHVWTWPASSSIHLPCLGTSAVSEGGCSSTVWNTVAVFLNWTPASLSWWKIGRHELSSVACASVAPPEDGSRPGCGNVFLFCVQNTRWTSSISHGGHLMSCCHRVQGLCCVGSWSSSRGLLTVQELEAQHPRAVRGCEPFFGMHVCCKRPHPDLSDLIFSR